jgi:hypothetical protein
MAGIPEPSREQEAPVEIVGADGETYRLRPFSPAVYELLGSWIVQRRLYDFQSYANRHKVRQSDRPEMVGQIMRHDPTIDDMSEQLATIPGQLFVIYQMARAAHPGLTAATLRTALLPMLPEAFNMYMNISMGETPAQRIDQRALKAEAERQAQGGEPDGADPQTSAGTGGEQ